MMGSRKLLLLVLLGACSKQDDSEAKPQGKPVSHKHADPRAGAPEDLVLDGQAAVSLLTAAALAHCAAYSRSISMDVCKSSLWQDYVLKLANGVTAHAVPLARGRMELVSFHGTCSDMTIADRAALVRRSVDYGDRYLGDEFGLIDPHLQLAGVTEIGFEWRGGETSSDEWGNSHRAPLEVRPCSIARIDRESDQSRKPNWDNLREIKDELLATLVTVRRLPSDAAKWTEIEMPEHGSSR